MTQEEKIEKMALVVKDLKGRKGKKEGFLAKEVREEVLDKHQVIVQPQEVTAYLHKQVEEGLLKNKPNGLHRYFDPEFILEPKPPKEKQEARLMSNKKKKKEPIPNLRGGLERGTGFKDLLPRKEKEDSAPEAQSSVVEESENDLPDEELFLSLKEHPWLRSWGFTSRAILRSSLAQKCAVVADRLVKYESKLKWDPELEELEDAARQASQEGRQLKVNYFTDRYTTDELVQVAQALHRLSYNTKSAVFIQRPIGVSILDKIYMPDGELDKALLQAVPLDQADKRTLNALIEQLKQHERGSEDKVYVVRSLPFDFVQRLSKALHTQTFSEKQCEAITQLNAGLVKKVAERDDRIRLLEGGKTRMSNQLQLSGERIRDFQRELESAKTENGTALAAQAALQDRFDSLKQELETTRMDKDAAQAAKADLERQLEDLKRERDQARKQLAEQPSHTDEVEQLKKDLADVREAQATERQQAIEASSAWKQEKANLEGEVEQLTVDLETLRKERGAAQAEPTDWQKEKDRLQRENFRLTEDLEAAVVARQRDNRTLLTLNNELRDQLAEAQKGTSHVGSTDVALPAEITKLQNDLTSARNVIENQKELLREKREKIGELEKELVTARAAAGDTSLEVVSRADHEAQLAAAQAKLTEASERLAELEKQPGICHVPANLGQHITDLTKELTQLREQVAKLMTDKREEGSRPAASSGRNGHSHSSSVKTTEDLIKSIHKLRRSS